MSNGTHIPFAGETQELLNKRNETVQELKLLKFQYLLDSYGVGCVRDYQLGLTSHHHISHNSDFYFKLLELYKEEL